MWLLARNSRRKPRPKIRVAIGSFLLSIRTLHSGPEPDHAAIGAANVLLAVRNDNPPSSNHNLPPDAAAPEWLP